MKNKTEELKKEIEDVEKGCGNKYFNERLVFHCGDRIYGLDLCSKCQRKLERLENDK